MQGKQPTKPESRPFDHLSSASPSARVHGKQTHEADGVKKEGEKTKEDFLDAASFA